MNEERKIILQSETVTRRTEIIGSVLPSNEMDKIIDKVAACNGTHSCYVTCNDTTLGGMHVVVLFGLIPLDLPGIIEGAADGRGRGRQVISTARTCKLILVV